MIKDEIADQLIYSTVKIDCNQNGRYSSGTGFFMHKMFDNSLTVNVIVTNKHVVQSFDEAAIDLVETDNNGIPDDKEHVRIHITDLQKRLFRHPEKEVDICFIPVGNELNKELYGRRVYFKSIPSDMALTNAGIEREALTSIEDVVMIGYPNGILDHVNNKPVVRRGITATHLKYDYNGKPDFMIDIACFFGSSGSPVFLRKMGLAKEQHNNGLTLGVRPNYNLIGILHSMSIAKANGEILVKEIPTALLPSVETDIPINLGQVTKAYKILELFDVYEKDLIRNLES